MKKVIFTVLGLVQVCVASNGLAQTNNKRFDSKAKFNQFSGKITQQILGAQSEAQLRSKGDQILSNQRRIVEQEFLVGNSSTSESKIEYGYVGNSYGLEFDRSFLLGFPHTINSGRVNELFFSYNFFDNINYDDPSVFYSPYNVGVNVLADTLTIHSEGFGVMKYIAQRNSNLSVQNLLIEESYTSGSFFSKVENVYSNDRISATSMYYGDIASNLELSETRKFTYNNDKVLTDSTFYYESGAVSGFDYLEYTYNANGKLTKLKFIDPTSLPDSAIFNFEYYTNNGLLKSAATVLYDNGVPFETFKDSVGYNNNGYLNFRKYKFADDEETIENTIKATFDGTSRLDTVKISSGFNGNTEFEAIGKYHYNVDNNPDSLSLYDPSDLSQKAFRYLFHYEPFNTTSTKTLAKNKDGFNIFPNPIEGVHFNVYCKNELKNRNAQITVIDIKGSKVFSTTQTLMQGNNAINIPTALAPGSYFVEIIADQSIFTQKLLKL